TSLRPAARPETLKVPERKPDPQPAPEPKRQAQRADRAQEASQGQAGQRAAGSGGQQQAGTTGRSQVKTLSNAQKSRLTAVWGGQIRARIERRKPRNTRGRGRVVLRITVARSGQVAGAGIARSSGIAAL
ncbi:energy transducer TonB, partial [Aquicoccus sp. SCR17]|nr:energy transducer TonB [Carideicomes alvinocaridis]